ncbi:MAG: GlsB/YeaQ/YmgE family stress response membrane protein [Clostridiaceae bacterium]|nr:GlsB/YeaQ/YmgE family stress response membrane protein [Clostridiaceae bacterium]
MNWLSWIVVGGIAGWIASLLTRSNARMGLLANIIVGIVGGLLGGFLMDLIGASGVTGFNLWSLLVSVIGATVLLWIINLIRKR